MFRPLCLILVCSCVLEVVAAEQVPAPGTQVEQVLADEAGDLGYLLYLPRSYQEEPDKEWPLVLFLHGRGESYGPLSLVAKWGPPKFAQRGDDLPFILVSPQCPGDVENCLLTERRHSWIPRGRSKRAALLSGPFVCEKTSEPPLSTTARRLC